MRDNAVPAAPVSGVDCCLSWPLFETFYVFFFGVLFHVLAFSTYNMEFMNNGSNWIDHTTRTTFIFCFFSTAFCVWFDKSKRNNSGIARILLLYRLVFTGCVDIIRWAWILSHRSKNTRANEMTLTHSYTTRRTDGQTVVMRSNMRTAAVMPPHHRDSTCIRSSRQQTVLFPRILARASSCSSRYTLNTTNDDICRTNRSQRSTVRLCAVYFFFSTNQRYEYEKSSAICTNDDFIASSIRSKSMVMVATRPTHAQQVERRSNSKIQRNQ